MKGRSLLCLNFSFIYLDCKKDLFLIKYIFRVKGEEFDFMFFVCLYVCKLKVYWFLFKYNVESRKK